MYWLSVWCIDYLYYNIFITCIDHLYWLFVFILLHCRDGEESWKINERSKDKILDFMRNPEEPPAPPAPETPWSEVESYVVHLTTDNFQSVLKKKKHSLIMFYAPCKHGLTLLLLSNSLYITIKSLFIIYKIVILGDPRHSWSIIVYKIFKLVFFWNYSSNFCCGNAIPTTIKHICVSFTL